VADVAAEDTEGFFSFKKNVVLLDNAGRRDYVTCKNQTEGPNKTTSWRNESQLKFLKKTRPIFQSQPNTSLL
jgi:hypothetical protein